MSKVAKTVGVIAAGVALVATGLGAAGVISAKLAGSISTYASLAAGAANITAQVTAPKPVARGSITNVIIETEPPRPYLMGETYFAGVLRHQVGYGATLKKVPNPYLWMVNVYSGVGPVEALVEPQFNYSAIGSYYTGFFDYDSQLGATPEATALVPPYGAATGWGASHKLSGCAALGWNLKFDKDGKVFASGLPVMGAIWKGVKCYDPRLDDTQAGGVGPHRLGDETTYTYTRNPALHAGTYAYGRYVSGKKVFGIGIEAEGIDWATISLWANDCEANNWNVDGVIFEGGTGANLGSQRKSNMDDICAAGGGMWLMKGAVLSFDWQRPRVSLATITDDDYMEEGGEIIALQTHRDRFNAVRPQYRSQAHNWELITADAIVGSTYQTEDGEEKVQTWPFNVVKDAAQAGQLATYAMADSREIGPITLTLGHEWRFYGPGDTLRIESEINNFNSDLVILRRDFDPDTFKTVLTLKGETSAKHAYALGEVAVPPPTPVIGQTDEERDAVAGYIFDPRGAIRTRATSPVAPYTPGDGQVAIVAHTATLEDGRELSLPAETITGLAVSSFFSLFWDLANEVYLTPTAPGTVELQSSQYVFLAGFKTSAGGTFPADPTPPPGVSGDPNYQEP